MSLDKSTKNGNKKEPKKMNNWLGIGCSIIGNAHIENKIPCQDSHYLGKLSQKWGIAVVSDGAGSHQYSHYGSSFMVKNVVKTLRELLRNESWFLNGSFPSPYEWRDVAITTFSFVYDNLITYGNKKGIKNPLKTMGGTINLLIYNDNGYLSAHIGDGRAAVQYEDNSWESIMKPFKGEHVGETVFLTSKYTWENISLCIESRVCSKKIKSFTLISDGLENYCFYCNVKDENHEIFYDPNKPYEPFFNTNIESIKRMYNNGKTVEEINKIFCNYLKFEHTQIVMESDDKTIILATKNDIL